MKIRDLLTAFMVCSGLVACTTTPKTGLSPVSDGSEFSAEAQPSKTAPAPSASDTSALNKKSQNPIASLISLPLQNNTNFGAGTGEKSSSAPTGRFSPAELSYELIDDLTLDLRLPLERIVDPDQRNDGTSLERQDLKLFVGIGFEF